MRGPLAAGAAAGGIFVVAVLLTCIVLVALLGLNVSVLGTRAPDERRGVPDRAAPRGHPAYAGVFLGIQRLLRRAYD